MHSLSFGVFFVCFFLLFRHTTQHGILVLQAGIKPAPSTMEVGSLKPLDHQGSPHSLNFNLEKQMATHSSILAWKIPWKEEPGRLQAMALQDIAKLLYASVKTLSYKQQKAVMGH